MHSDMSEKEINELSEKFKARRTDAMLLNLDGRNYYLVYEKIGYSGLDVSGTCPGGYRQCQYEQSAA